MANLSAASPADSRSDRWGLPFPILPVLGALALPAILAAATGWCWAALSATLGTTPANKGAWSPAQGGALLINQLADQYLNQTAIEGRIVLMPFQPILWGDPSGATLRIESIETRVFVPGLTHLDVVADQTSQERVIFRFSRHPEIPSGFIVQRHGIAVARERMSNDWNVAETILTPERRGELVQANYHSPQRTFRDIGEAFQGEWFDIRVSRQGDRLAAHVNGTLCDEIGDVQVKPGAWGLEGGDLPFVYVKQLDFTALRREEMGWRRFMARLTFEGPWAPWGARVGAGLRFAGLALALLITVATLAWRLAPGVSWTLWMRRMTLCGLALAAPPAWLLRHHGVEFPFSLVQTLWVSLIGVGILWWLLLAAAGPHWRHPVRPLQEARFLGTLRTNWRALRPHSRALVWAGAAILAAYFPLNAFVLRRLEPPVPVVSEPLLWSLQRPMRRGDVLRTRGDDFGDGSVAFQLTAAERPTTVEILSRLRPHWLNTVWDWVALRLSTEPGQSGWLASDSLAPMQAIDFTLPVGRAVAVRLINEESLLRFEVDGREVARWKNGDYALGAYALIVREGGVAVAHGIARARPVQEGPGAEMRLWAAGDLATLPATLAITLGVAVIVAWLLASWCGVEVGSVLGHVWGVAFAFLATWLGASLWWASAERGTYGHSPLFPLCLALLVAGAGLYLWLAAHWSRLRRRLLPAAVLALSAPLLIEATLRASPQRWSLMADFQGGYVRDELLMRPQLSEMLWQFASGDVAPRGHHIHGALPSEGTLRVLCLGGSSTYGSGVANPKQTWPHYLQRILSEKRRVEVLNFGYPSLSSFDDLELLRHELLALRPDWIILSLGGNDAIAPEDNPPPQREQWESFQTLTPTQRFLRRVFLRTRLVVGLNRWISHATTPPTERHTVPQVPPEDFRKTLEEICDLAAQHHIGVAFVAEPMWETLVFKDSRHAPWHRVLAEVAAERGAVFIDPAPAFAGRLDDNLWATWIHPTAKGNRLMAEALAPALEAAIASREALSFREDW